MLESTTPQAVRDAAQTVEQYFRNAGRLIWTLGGIQSVQQGTPFTTELVSWITDGTTPDDERTVLINVVTEDVALVRDGFWSDGKWHDAEGWEIRQAKVVAWSEKPKGPQLAKAAAAGVAG